MEPFKVYVLGCGSALPTLKHYASAQVVEIRNKLFLIDCGEGTQMQLRRSHIHFMKIQRVFISHLHGDHCFGLIGMISTFGMLGRTASLHVYGPSALQPILDAQLKIFCQNLSFTVEFHAVDTSKVEIIYEDKSLTVSTLPLNHRLPCCGFLFREKPLLPHIRRDWTLEDGATIPHERLVIPADLVRSYAYCSDTCYMPQLHEWVKGVDLLYHESTYADDNKQMAARYYHSTARQAATVARDAKVGKLLLGHYSSRYENEQILLKEAREVFAESYLSQENDVFDV